ncbi:diaminopimelate decarboxylase family protein [Lacrimispora amygdalina]|uniref:diaminopimelate decarboxylase family protein n=1 Tax=Lacrimispora amygdalina TaxID=253257 RepID=UPI001A9A468A|nr:alanine racemase [Lacrimispora amygdalina]
MKTAFETYKTPFYLFNTDILTSRISDIRAALPTNTQLCFAMKANPFLVKDMENHVDYFEVCSPGEFHICERAGIDKKQIVMSGVYKNQKDMEYAIMRYADSIIFTVESYQHWQILSSCAEQEKKNIRVLLRLTSGNQFGMDEKSIRRIISEAPYQYVEILGLQYFSGTQKKFGAKLKNELMMLDQLCTDLQNQYHFTVKKLEYGPGLPVCYFEGETNEEETMLLALASALCSLNFKGQVTLEMGRFIAASCGLYATSVVDLKTNNDQSYCIVDGGIHQLNYYGQMLAMKKPFITHYGKKEGGLKEWTVCGSLCTASDVLVRQYPLKGLEQGDLLVFQKTGAYSATEGMAMFLSRDLPLVLLYSEKEKFRVARPTLAADRFNYLYSERG